MRYTQYIWDFDGTLFDTYPHSTAAMCRAMEEAGFAPAVPADAQTIFLRLQITLRAGAEYLGVSPEIYRRFEALEADFSTPGIDGKLPAPFPGIPALLSDICAAGGKNYLYTNRNTNAIRALQAAGLWQFFSDAVTAEDRFPGKPKPDAVLALLSRNGLPKEACIMVGDREIDGASGVAAGISGCLLTFLTENWAGEDPLAVTAMPWKCRGIDAFRRLMQIVPASAGHTDTKCAYGNEK